MEEKITEERILNKILKELCEEMQIEMKKLSYGWIVELKKGHTKKYIVGTNFPLNSSTSAMIASDKYATYEVLNALNIPAVEHKMIFNPKTRSRYSDEKEIEDLLKKEFEKNSSWVVKPNYGSNGLGIERCEDLERCKNVIGKLFETNDSISLCPYYDIEKEYRCFYLEGRVLLIYGKTKPFVIGNGISNLEQLISKLNLPNKPIVRENLKVLDLKRVPQEGEKVEISWKHNLSGGATADILEKGELYDRIEELAKLAGKALEVGFATIDIIQTKQNELAVMEINSGIGTEIFAKTVENGYERIKEVYRKALEAMFL